MWNVTELELAFDVAQELLRDQSLTAIERDQLASEMIQIYLILEQLKSHNLITIA